MTETLALPQLPADPPGQQLKSQSSRSEVSSRLYPVAQGPCFSETKDLESVDQASSAAVNPVKRVAPGETTTTTETDSQWLPKQGHPKGDPTLQTPWEPETADLCATRLQLRHCSHNEDVEVELALFQSEATQLGESPETAFSGMVREGRGEVRVSTLTAEEKRELVRAKQSAGSGQTVRNQQLHETRPLFKLPRGQVCIPHHSCE